MTDLIRVRHTVSGVIAEVPKNIFEHEILGAYLEEVGPEAKPYLPEMHRTSLPKNPTEDQIAVALSAGFIDEAEAKDLRSSVKSEAAKTRQAKVQDEKEALYERRVALDEAHNKEVTDA